MSSQMLLNLNYDVPTQEPTQSGAITVRGLRPSESDKKLIVEFGRKIFEESKKVRKSLQNRTYNEEKCGELFDNWKQGADIYAAIAERDGVPIGAVAAYTLPCHFSDGFVAFDLFVYVEPEHRGGKAAFLLIDSYEKWAKQHDVIEICLGVSTGIHPEKTGSFYERLGYEKVGCNFVKEMN